MTINEIVENQRKFFATGATKDVQYRLDALNRLYKGIEMRKADIFAALKKDFNKSNFETYMTEISMVRDDLRYVIKHVKKWAKIKKVSTPVIHFLSKSFIVPEPYGVALIMSPWNYPFQLCLEPLTGAIAGGNCAVVKPSAYTPETSRVIAELIAELFPPEYVTVVEGGRSQNTELLEEKFDYIFFTGSVNVGKLVMEKAAQHLTPVSLELGGKSPTIVDKSANLKVSARRIAFGKYLNAGQTCIAPDYLYVHESVKDEFIGYMKQAITDFFPRADYSDLPVIINDKHFNRLLGLMDGEDILFGGSNDPAKRFIEPTILDNITWRSKVMGEEIFGPILPVLTYSDTEEVIAAINAQPKPLALYVFSDDTDVQNMILSRISFGGGCINDTIIHAATHQLGFGGVGESGMGSYHGKYSFDTFTHYKSIIKKSNRFDLKIRYHPYTEKKFKQLTSLLK